jgi:hypothetical protein
MDTGSAIRRAIDRDAAIVLHERSIGSIDPVEWDRFATATDGSFLGATLYLGITEPGQMPEAYPRGNLLYRRKLRAVSVPGTAFTLEVG